MRIDIPVGSVVLAGELGTPVRPRGLIVFAHGSGSSRHSPRNRLVAQRLQDGGFGTLLFDLLTEAEAQDRANVFDIEPMGRRLADVTRSLKRDPTLGGLPIGYFGASTGAAAALWAAASDPALVGAVVSRGGRPDLTGRLPDVLAPTRLIVGGLDGTVLDLNRSAQAQLTCENDLVVIPGASHLFEEPGTLERAAAEALSWFQRHLVKRMTSAPTAQEDSATDPGLARLTEDAEGMEAFGAARPARHLLLEEAQGIEAFTDPAPPLETMVEGSPGHESLVYEDDDDDERREQG